MLLIPVKNEVNYQNSQGSGKEIKLFKLFMKHKQKYMRFLLKSYSFRSMLHHVYITAYSLPFQSKFAKCVRGQSFSVLNLICIDPSVPLELSWLANN